MELFKSNLAVGITAAIAATVLAPVLVPVIAAAGRPLAKSLVKGGVILYEKGREAVAGAGEVMEDMIAEVRSEMEQQPRAGAVAAGAAGAATTVQQPAAAPDTGAERAPVSGAAATAPRPTGDGARM